MKASYCTRCRMSRMSRTNEFRRAAPVLACVDLDWTEHPTGRDGVHGQLVRSLRAGRRPRTYERISSHVPPRCVPMCTQPFLSSCSPPHLGTESVHDRCTTLPMGRRGWRVDFFCLFCSAACNTPPGHSGVHGGLAVLSSSSNGRARSASRSSLLKRGVERRVNRSVFKRGHTASSGPCSRCRT